MESTTTSKNKDVTKMTVPKERNWMLPTFLRRPCHSEIIRHGIRAADFQHDAKGGASTDLLYEPGEAFREYEMTLQKPAVPSMKYGTLIISSRLRWSNNWAQNCSSA